MVHSAFGSAFACAAVAPPAVRMSANAISSQLGPRSTRRYSCTDRVGDYPGSPPAGNALTTTGLVTSRPWFCNHLVVLVQSQADQSRDRLRRTTLAARAAGVTIVAATLVALVFSLRSGILERLARTADWVPLVESVVNDLVFAATELCNKIWQKISLLPALRPASRRSPSSVRSGRSWWMCRVPGRHQDNERATRWRC